MYLPRAIAAQTGVALRSIQSQTSMVAGREKESLDWLVRRIEAMPAAVVQAAGANVEVPVVQEAQHDVD